MISMASTLKPVVDEQVLLATLRARYATKSFDPSRKIPADTWQTLEHVMVLAPSSFGLQPWKFIVISDPALRATLRPHSWGQSQITDASHMVVFAGRVTMTDADVDRHLNSIVTVRGVDRNSLTPYGEMMKGFMKSGVNLSEWVNRQVYIALGQFLTSAALLGLDACPMEGFVPAEYDSALGLADSGYRSVVVATAGYRSSNDVYADAKKVRFDLADVIVRR